MTNFVETRQTQSKCEEDYHKVTDCICETDSDCPLNLPKDNNWNGSLPYLISYL